MLCVAVILDTSVLCASRAQIGKSSANRASKAVNKKAATAAAEEGSAALSAAFAKGAKALEDLRKVGIG